MSLSFSERYLNGETEAVYLDIAKLGAAAFLPEHFSEVEKVLTETFRRVSFNLNIIYSELKNRRYVFWNDKFGDDEGLIKPSADTNLWIETIEKRVKPAGYLPLSLKMFYKIAGSCDFTWNYMEEETIRWEMADPIQIIPLEALVLQVSSDYWLEQARAYLEDEDFGCAFLELAADDLQKDNISGGAPYSLQLTQEPSIDSNFLNEPNDTTFIGYLRICFEHCGFPGLGMGENQEDYQAFFDLVKPKLIQI